MKEFSANNGRRQLFSNRPAPSAVAQFVHIGLPPSVPAPSHLDDLLSGISPSRALATVFLQARTKLGCTCLFCAIWTMGFMPLTASRAI